MKNMNNYCMVCKHILKMTLKYNFRTFCSNQNDLRNIRNIGILAHIDAGKTTTTERMLYYAGRIHHMGEVHDGNTVTDYMEQERNRGITITSASVTIPWLNHRINIIDTPGHIDFTMQVEQSLSVIDGAIIILDGSAGVEAQTLTVWQQADRYKIPRIVYINKMDRADASLSLCLDSLKSKFDVETLPLQLPIKSTPKNITGIVDLISCKHVSWHGDEGDVVKRVTITQKNSSIWEEVQFHRTHLIDRLTDLDDKLTDIVLASETLENVSQDDIYEALQRVTISQKAVPVLCGSSYKNIGVQLLLDSVVKCLPSPDMRNDLEIYKCFEQSLSAKAFKVVHDKQKGPITFFRIYTGCMTKNQKLFNMSKEIYEQSQRVMEVLADEYKEVSEITAGNIAAVTGLKKTVIGNLVTSSQNATKNAIKKLIKLRNISENESAELLCPPNKILQPVFFCTIEAPSPAYQTALDNALEELQREDPSLTITYDNETCQTIMGGMGELHLDIINDRILTEYKIEADLGPLQIAYKEYLVSKRTETHLLDMVVGSSKYKVTMTMSVYPKVNYDDKLLLIDKHPDYVSNTCAISARQLNALHRGVESCLTHGPKVGCPVLNAQFMIHWLEASKYVPDSILISASAQCANKLIASAGTKIVEPLVRLEIVTDEHRMSSVLGDLSRRRSQILQQTMRGKSRVLYALAPLAELLGYSKQLRILTSGHSTFTMELHSYKEVVGQDEKEAIKNITGFYPS